MNYTVESLSGYCENKLLLTYTSSYCQTQQNNTSNVNQHYVLSDEEDYDLTLEAALDNTVDSILPEIYLTDCEREFYGRQLKKKYNNPIQRVVDEYNKLHVKPYVKIRDASNPFGTDPQEGKPKPGCEFGIKISF